MIKLALFFISIGISFIINTLLTPLIIKLAHRNQWYDLPDHRKIHTGLIPRLGGVGIFLSFIISTFGTTIAFSVIFKRNLVQISDFKPFFFLCGLFMIHLLGLVDDIKNQKAVLKLIIQIIAAGIVAAGGYLVDTITIPYFGTIHLSWLSYPVTIVWIIGITNAVNLVDGMDGLAGGISAFASFSMGVIALLQGQMLTAVIAFGLFGAIAGFLVYNLPPAKIFMGDSGSLLLGFALSVIPLMGISTYASLTTMLIPITLLMVPIVDTTAAIIRRIKKKQTIMTPDKEHIHHKLLNMGFSEKRILGIIYGICFYLSIIAITTVTMPKEANVFLVLVVWLGTMMGYGIIQFLTSTRRELAGYQSEDKKNEKNSA
ncbi:MAG: undecaprenyl/decaprenyl-phosphate alpha-N-acetylglucosaminyl 1-phosphate transferase [Spirochaetales bacterium]|nr:undecaprenyl/decaprenyl-phosphate alpha-N-acetylglucosaminyl 1-phosphate transferase [Spirochaetales bacterium]